MTGWFRVLVVALPVLWMVAHATTRLDVGVGDIQGPGWRATGVALAVDILAEDRAALRLSAQAIQLPAPFGALSNIEVSCPDAKVLADIVHCERGVARFAHERLGIQEPEVGFVYRAGGVSELEVDGVRLGEGRLAIDGSWGAGGWEATLTGRDIPLDRTADLAGLVAPLPELDLAGRATFRSRLSGVAGALGSARVEADVSALDFSDAGSTRVGQDVQLGLDLDLDLQRGPEGWAFDAALALDAGELYLEPVYLEVPERALRISLKASWSPASRALQVDAFELDHGGVIRASGKLGLTLGEQTVVESADLELTRADLPVLYTTYLQPFLIGTVLDDLETAGQLSAALRVRDGRVSLLDAKLQEVFVDDRAQRFGIYDADADLRWRDDPMPVDSELRLAGGHVLGIDIGSASLAFESTDQTLTLAEPATVPVLDGRLNVSAFSMGGIGDGLPAWHFDAGLTPISMESLTHALGWPILSGKLSGMIPDVRYADGTVTVGGALLVRVFGGSVTVHNLRLENPLGLVPELSADIVLDDLDLERLTRRFAFGQITGRLGGEVRDLRLVAWKPVSFDARFATPRDDRSRHRISQRAVDNLTRLGSGVSGVLSTGFFSLFEEFAYDKIGLSCRLRNGICEMDGVGPAENGYYIVRGRGLPRVDVIGYNRRVAWDVLVERLKDRLERPAVVQ